MDIITNREKELKSVIANSVQLKLMLPDLKKLLANSQAAYDALRDATDYEDELREARLPSLKPIADVEEHLATLAAALQWIRRFIQDIENT